MVHDVIFALWFLLPAAIANVTPILSAVTPLLKRWNAPMDGGHKYRGKEIFGTHKTWRGFITGILAATLVFWLQQILVSHFGWAQSLSQGIDYAVLPTLLLGPLFGVGALGGDAVESFFKRQRGVKSGRAWIPFDQLDYIIGGLLVSLPFVILEPIIYAYILFIWFVVHLAASYAGWLAGLKERPI